VRASTDQDAVLSHELAALVEQRAGVFHQLIGPRTLVSTDAGAIGHLVPDIARRDVYVCGPPGYVDAVVEAARVLGTPVGAIHREAFTF
jgi:ferredoxin-NADP reductase